MNLLFKYTFKKFFVISFVLTLLIIAMLWLAQSLRYMDLIVNNSISMGSYFSLVAFLIPDLFVVISPIAFAISALFCFHRLMITHELAALRSLGISNLRLSSPVLAIAALLFMMLMSLNIFIVPASFQKLKEQEHVMRSAFSGALLREGSFNTAKGFTLYVREHNDKDELYGVFIYQPTKDDAPARTTLAESGRVYKNGDRLLILLKKGQRQDYNPETRQYARFAFNEFVYDLTDAIGGTSQRTERASEKSITQLLQPDNSVMEDMRRRFRSEAHQRILLPFLSFFDALFISGLLLSGDLGRRHNRHKIILAAGGVLIIHLITMGLLHSSVRIHAMLWLAYVFVSSGILGSLAYLAQDLILTWRKGGYHLKERLSWEKRA